ncbi:hypothetical protein RIF29_11230 [Crotalaria pallida]|uniref:Uncharacterized protein n=1 Tax=Crotalaria pallida TaxID=3830 RepID=A0AAN9ILX6_CROPI
MAIHYQCYMLQDIAVYFVQLGGQRFKLIIQAWNGVVFPHILEEDEDDEDEADDGARNNEGQVAMAEGQNSGTA